jgi:hypothetical protein
MTAARNCYTHHKISINKRTAKILIVKTSTCYTQSRMSQKKFEKVAEFLFLKLLRTTNKANIKT